MLSSFVPVDGNLNYAARAMCLPLRPACLSYSLVGNLDTDTRTVSTAGNDTARTGHALEEGLGEVTGDLVGLAVHDGQGAANSAGGACC